MYSISYIPSGGDFANQECAFWSSYGRPYEFKSFAEAAARINSIPWLHQLSGKVVTLRTAEQMSLEMVEVYSGRRKVDGFRRVLHDESRPRYEQVMLELQIRLSLSCLPVPRFPVETITQSPIERLPRDTPPSSSINFSEEEATSVS